MKKYIIKTTSKMRYPSLGDYWIDKLGRVQIRVLKLGNSNYEFLIAIHEIIEQYLTESNFIKEEIISAFDVEYEEARSLGVAAPCGCYPTETSEPGDDEHSPYYEEHQFATKIEKEIAKRIKVDWKKYEKETNKCLSHKK